MLQKLDASDDLFQLKNKIVDWSLIVFSVFVLIINLIVFYRNTMAGFGISFSFYIELANTLLVLLAAIFRNQLSINKKVFCLVFSIVAVTTSVIYFRGYLGSVKAFIILTPVFLSFVISFRAAIISFFGFTFIYLMGFWGFTTGVRQYNFDVIAYITHPMTWSVELVLIIFTSGGFLIIAHYFRTRLELNYTKIEEQNSELLNKDQKYEQLFESANDAIVLLENNVMIDVNTKTCEYLEMTKTEIIGKSPADLSPAIQPDGSHSSFKSLEYISEAFTGNARPFEWQHISATGKRIDFSVVFNVVKLNNKTFIQGILRDITESKLNQRELEKYRYNLEELVKQKTIDLEVANQELRNSNIELHEALKNLKDAQSQLVQSEKMASLGVLTAGVAHEINNPLNYILGGYQALEEYYNTFPEAKDPTVEKLLTIIKTGADRATAIVHGLNQFNRSNDKYNEVCDIHAIIENCLLMLKSTIKNEVELVRKYEAENPIILGNSGKLHQVFTNIITNSMHSIKANGTIEIYTTSRENTMEITISDTGTGIKPEHLQNISDPFFTTKNPGEGTGLGLSITFNIVKEHQGTITYNSKLGKGTVATILLPYD